jgi:hypothetical protein
MRQGLLSFFVVFFWFFGFLLANTSDNAGESDQFSESLGTKDVSRFIKGLGFRVEG